MSPGTIYKPVVADQSYSGYDNVIKEETISTERVSVWKAHYTAMGKVSTLIKIVQDTGWELKNAEAYFNQNIGQRTISISMKSTLKDEYKPVFIPGYGYQEGMGLIW